VPRELRLPQRAAEEVVAEFAADVSDRPGGSGDRDAVAARDVAAGEGAGAVNQEPGPFLPSNCRTEGDVDGSRDRPQKLPKRRGARMTQHGPIPRREHRRQPPPPPRETPMPHRIHAPVQPMQPPRIHRPPNRRFVKSRFAKLRNSHHTVLSTRDQRDPLSACGAFLSHRDSKAPQHLISPPSRGG
jgi:hypothetical protein